MYSIRRMSFQICLHVGKRHKILFKLEKVPNILTTMHESSIMQFTKASKCENNMSEVFIRQVWYIKIIPVLGWSESSILKINKYFAYDTNESIRIFKSKMISRILSKMFVQMMTISIIVWWTVQLVLCSHLASAGDVTTENT